MLTCLFSGMLRADERAQHERIDRLWNSYDVNGLATYIRDFVTHHYDVLDNVR